MVFLWFCAKRKTIRTPYNSFHVLNYSETVVRAAIGNMNRIICRCLIFTLHAETNEKQIFPTDPMNHLIPDHSQCAEK